MKICSIDGCGNKHKGLDYCEKHYQRFKKHGDPLIYFAKKMCGVDECMGIYYGRGFCGKHYQRWVDHKNVDHIRTPRFKSPLEAYEAHVIKRGDQDCWSWSGKKDGMGYGVLRYKPKIWRAHRFSYNQFVNPIPEGLFVCHKCDQPLCTNPKHLFLGTSNENFEDCRKKMRHVMGSRCHNAKITEVEALNIKLLLHNGCKTIHVSNKLSVAYNIVSNIKYGKTWKHIQIGDNNGDN